MSGIWAEAAYGATSNVVSLMADVERDRSNAWTKGGEEMDTFFSMNWKYTDWSLNKP